MNEEETSELQRIRAEQRALREAWTRLEQRIDELEAAAGAPVPLPVIPPRPPPAPGLPPPVAKPSPEAVPGVASRESLEVRIGGTWLVRAGIVLLLTSLAFLGNYLYRNVVPHLGPAAKVGLLYLGSGLIAAFGAWLERSRQARAQSGLQDYARVVLAGGLAAIYYVTYAAHFYPNLRVIASPMAAGALLLGWTAFMVWLAARRDSETLATFAILLAFYASAVNEIAAFTLWSNLALAIGAVYLLRRHLWRVFPFASLVATFGSYGFWRYYHAYATWRGFDFSLAQPRYSGGFWTDTTFLGLYWFLFTGAVFAPGAAGLPPARRAAFATLNNGAFFVLTTWSMLGDYPGNFWKWSLLCGVVLLVLAEAGRRLRSPLDETTEGAYAFQGVLLVTMGLIAYLDGWQLGLALAVESALLVAAAGRRSSVIILFASCVCALLAACAAQGTGFPRATVPWVTQLCIGGLLLLDGWWCARLAEKSLGAASEPSPWLRNLRIAPAWFSFLAAAVWLALIERRITAETRHAPLLVLAAILLTAGSGLLRMPVVAVYAQAYVILAHARWLVVYGRPHQVMPPSWNTLVVLGGTAALGWWWKRGRRAASGGPRSNWDVLDATLATLSGWRLLTARMSQWHGSAFTLAGGWSLYAAAVFALGLLLGERAYRWLGLLILAATLTRVALVDIWQLDLLGRACSALSLGAVLLAVGFLYNRYQSRFRDIF